LITILKPIWNGGQRYLGLAEYRVATEPATVTVECTYLNKTGDRLYPKPLKIAKHMILRQKTMMLKPSGTIIYLVPIEAFECPVTKKELTSEIKPNFEIKEAKNLPGYV
jgi:hypothetical protein